MSRLLRCALLLALPAFAHAADPADLEQRLTPAQMHETGLDTLTPAQLARLNALLRETATPVTPATPATAASPAAPPPGSGAPADHAWNIGLADKPIVAHAKGTITGWAPDTVFDLDNGQRWKVLKGEAKLRHPLESPQIQVVPGVAGRWFLEVDENLPKARVYRID